ncbi:Diaminopimelate decarboxylase [hydrothermal vent metagenome]|uniref:diaminopimelate decarboxylase n=1 Tax=hydrothermal vent metagenome TaxID=652676 RepID=A0A3B0ZIC6_9ZZZZ
MNHFEYHGEQLFAEDVPLSEIAQQWDTPTFVYSRATLERHWHAFDQALGEWPHLICYAVKANSNLAILNLFARLGSGFDIVSVGELERVLAAGGDAKKVVFSGVGKKAHEMQRALEVGIRCFNIESVAELELLNQVAGEQNTIAPISIRVNPDVDAGTHPYISTGLKENKFGIDIQQAPEIYQQAAAMANIEIQGVDCHIGSQLTSITPFIDALERVLVLIEALSAQGIELKHLDLGGGLGIQYENETPPDPNEYAAALKQILQQRGLQIELVLEPGRAIVGNAGVMLTQVQYLKHTEHKNFAIVDAAMNDLLRPSLYQAWQEIVPLKQHAKVETQQYDIVGPVCETGDFLGKERHLALQTGDYLAVRSSGAYGFSMSSNYNTRPRAAEVMVDGKNSHLIRKRETIAELFASESLLPE